MSRHSRHFFVVLIAQQVYPEELHGSCVSPHPRWAERPRLDRCRKGSPASPRTQPLRFPSPHRRRTKIGVAHTKTKRRSSCNFPLRFWLPRGYRRKRRCTASGRRRSWCETGVAARARFRTSRCRLFFPAAAIVRKPPARPDKPRHLIPRSHIPLAKSFPAETSADCTCFPAHSATARIRHSNSPPLLPPYPPPHP